MKTILIAHLVFSVCLYLSAINFLTKKARSFLKDKEISFSRMAITSFGSFPIFFIPIFGFLVYLRVLDTSDKEISKYANK